MAQANPNLDLDEDFASEVESDDAEAKDAPVSKTNLAKRRVIDNLMEERRLKKQLADYDYDL